MNKSEAFEELLGDQVDDRHVALVLIDRAISLLIRQHVEAVVGNNDVRELLARFHVLLVGWLYLGPVLLEHLF